VLPLVCIKACPAETNLAWVVVRVVGMRAQGEVEGLVLQMCGIGGRAGPEMISTV